MTFLLSLAAFATTIDWRPDLPAPGPRGACVVAGTGVLMPGRADDKGARLVCFVSAYEGKTWTPSGTIATDPDRRTDLGDGNIVAGQNGKLFAVYRHNHHGPGFEKPDYAIEVSTSTDGGKTWTKDSEVASSRPEGPGPSRGLWSPYLFLTRTGDLQCYFDDEETPARNKFPGHQWLTMKTYSRSRHAWTNPVCVARSHDPVLLSRDGMASVVETEPGHLLCAFESVQTSPPHAGLIRMVTSLDGGQSWSWTPEERKVLYEPRDVRFHAFAPSILALPHGQLIALFATNEDRPEPGRSGTPASDLSLDIKYVSSPDNGRTWEPTAHLLYGGSHRNYLPGIVQLPGRGIRLLSTMLDFDRGCLSKIGEGR